MREVSTAVIGLGRVGQVFLRSAALLPTDGLGFMVRVRAVADRSGALLLGDEPELRRALLWKESGGSLAAFGPDGVVPPGRLVEEIPRLGIDLLVACLASRLEDGQPGLDLIEAALAAGIHVVTVDKAPLVRGTERLEAAARSSGAILRTSGTTGVVPPIGIEREGVVEIRGVLNGATNYILTEMVDRSASFDAALADACRLGLTEPDPGRDLEGWDTAIKITLLARAVMQSNAGLEEVARVGLGPDVERLVANARANGRRVRLVGRARIWQGRFRLSVAPKIVGPDSPFFSVEGTSKAAIFRTGSDERLVRGLSGPAETGIVILRDIHAIFFPDRKIESIDS